MTALSPSASMSSLPSQRPIKSATNTLEAPASRQSRTSCAQATGLDTAGALFVKDGVMADFGPELFTGGVPEAAGGSCSKLLEERSDWSIGAAGSVGTEGDG